MMLALYLRVGGLERMVESLCYGLRDRGHNVTVCTLREQGAIAEPLQEAGFTVVCLNSPPRIDTASVQRLRNLLKEHQIDILHSHNDAALLFGSAATIGLSIPHICTRHGSEVVSKKSAIRNRIAAFGVDRFVTVSNPLEQLIRQHEKVPARKATTIINGIDGTKLATVPDRVFTPGAPIIGHVARLAPVKNQRLLLDGFRLLVDQWPQSQLEIVGEGELRSQLEQQITRQNLTGNVTFHGLQDDVIPFLSRFHIFTLTSDTEGTPMSMLEALASGLPVVSTNVGGIPDIINNYENGVLTETSTAEQLLAAWQYVYSDAQQYSKMVQAARDTDFAAYEFDKMLDSYLRIYAEHVNNSA